MPSALYAFNPWGKLKVNLIKSTSLGSDTPILPLPDAEYCPAVPVYGGLSVFPSLLLRLVQVGYPVFGTVSKFPFVTLYATEALPIPAGVGR